MSNERRSDLSSVPRASLRAAWTLSSVRWMPLPPSSGSGQPPPMWRQHFAAVSSGRYVIVHGGQGSDSMRTCAYDLTTATWHDVAEVRRITARSLYPPLYPPRKLPSAHLTSLTSPYFPHLTLPSALPSDLTLRSPYTSLLCRCPITLRSLCPSRVASTPTQVEGVCSCAAGRAGRASSAGVGRRARATMRPGKPAECP